MKPQGVKWFGKAHPTNDGRAGIQTQGPDVSHPAVCFRLQVGHPVPWQPAICAHQANHDPTDSATGSPSLVHSIWSTCHTELWNLKKKKAIPGLKLWDPEGFVLCLAPWQPYTSWLTVSAPSVVGECLISRYGEHIRSTNCKVPLVSRSWKYTQGVDTLLSERWLYMQSVRVRSWLSKFPYAWSWA